MESERGNSLIDACLTLFFKFQESLGGRVRVMVTGAAPISPSVLNFLRASLGCQVMQPYYEMCQLCLLHLQSHCKGYFKRLSLKPTTTQVTKCSIFLASNYPSL